MGGIGCIAPSVIREYKYMCTKEEVKTIVDASESRMEDKLYTAYQPVAKAVSNLGADVAELRDIIKEHVQQEEKYQDVVKDHLRETKQTLDNLAHLTVDDIKALKDIAQGYAGMGAVKKMILGLAGIVLAIGAVIAGFITIVKAIR
jgi:chromosome segregation ATPase